jgi:RNA-directed DNA polymerase
VKVRGEAHPFDPKYDEYFRDLRKRRVMNTLLAGKKLKDLWLEQGGLCPGCQQPIDLSRDVWHRHHLQRRKEGGSDEAYNLVLLHQTCHHQVHVRRKTVKKPDPRSREEAQPEERIELSHIFGPDLYIDAPDEHEAATGPGAGIAR